MSIPAGKPQDPIDLSENVPQQAPETPAAARSAVAAGDQPARSPYAPKPAHERAAAGQSVGRQEHDPLRSPYAPKSERAPAAAQTELGGQGGAQALQTAGVSPGSPDAADRGSTPHWSGPWRK